MGDVVLETGERERARDNPEQHAGRKAFSETLRLVRLNAVFTVLLNSVSGICRFLLAACFTSVLVSDSSITSEKEWGAVIFCLLLLRWTITYAGLQYGCRRQQFSSGDRYGHVTSAADRSIDRRSAIDRMIFLGIDVSLIIASFLIGFLRLHHLEGLDRSAPGYNRYHTFYTVVTCYGCVAFVGVLHGDFFMYEHIRSHSMRKYYDETVRRGFQDFWKCLFDGSLLPYEKMKDISSLIYSHADLSNQMKVETCLPQYRDLAEFMYLDHKPHGVEAARVALLSDDAYLKNAAVNMVQVWVEMDLLKDFTRHDKKLLSALAQVLRDSVLNTAQVAALCFETLGEKAANIVVGVKAENSRENLVDILIDMVDSKDERESTLFIKALIPLMQLLMLSNNGGNTEYAPVGCSEEKLAKLRRALRQILENGCTEGQQLNVETLASAAFAYGITNRSQNIDREIADRLVAVTASRGGEEYEKIKLLLESPECAEAGQWFKRVKTPPQPELSDIPLMARRRSFELFANCFAFIPMIALTQCFAWGSYKYGSNYVDVIYVWLLTVATSCITENHIILMRFLKIKP